MKSTKLSIIFMLKHSIVTLVAIIAFTTVFIVIQLLISVGNLESYKAFQLAMMINLMLATFVGIYFGGALFSLKQNYLWTINQYYRSAIMTAYLILIGVFSILQMPFLYLNLSETLLVLLVPFCISIFSSQMVLAKNALHKIIIPAIPFLILQLYRIDVSVEMIIVFIIISTVILLYSMYLNRLYPEGDKRKKTINNQIRTNESLYTGTLTVTINHFIGIVVSKWVTSSKKAVTWAVLLPHTNLAISSLLYILLIAIAVLITGDESANILQKFSILFLTGYVIEIVMESSHQIRQTRVFSHVFEGKNHRQLKSNILLAIDKGYVTNSLIFFGGVLVLISIFSLEANINQLIYSAIAVMLIAVAVYPLLLCLSWVNITFPVILSTSLYVAMVIGTLFWIDINTEQVLHSPYSIVFILSCLLIRVFSQTIFWRYPLEKLLKNV